MPLFFALSSASAAPARSPRLERFALILAEPPLARRIASRAELGAPASIAAGRSILNRQKQINDAATGLGAIALGATHILLNAVYVAAPGADEAALRGIPGVVRVVRMEPIHRQLNRALDLVNAKTAWTSVGGQQNAGAGVAIAILDTGIDQNHPAFQDNFTPFRAGFPKCSGGDCAYTNHKVVAARSYVNMLVLAGQAAYSRPDDLTPRDRVGHGTALAMVAAGQTVQGAISSPITGMAPKALLGNYKVFGSPGVNDVTFDNVLVKALEDAFQDGMDVALLALGSPALWGPYDRDAVCHSGGVTGPCDPRAAAVENAVSRGMTVVVAAGNDGNGARLYPALGSVDSPATAPSAISAGATTNAHIIYSSLRVPGAGVPSNLALINTFFGDSPKPAAPFTAPLIDGAAAGGPSNPNACGPFGPASLAGQIVLLQRDNNCDLITQARNAATAGATGIVFYQYANNQIVFPFGGVSSAGLPAVLIGNTDGLALKSFLAANPAHPVTLDPSLLETNASYDAIAFFSSRGPNIGTATIKPEVAAVGSDLYVATQNYDPNGDHYDPTGFTTVEGTSFSAAMTAGAVALVKQAHPTYSPAQLKSAVVNTASETIVDFDANNVAFQASVTAVGGGKLNTAAAVQSNVTVAPATLSFGAVGASLPSTTLAIANTGNSAVNLQLAVAPRIQDANAAISLSPSSVSLAPGQTANVTAALTGALPLPGSYEGDVTIQGGAIPLHVPYLYVAGDGIPFNAYALRGAGFEGTAGGPLIGDLLLKVVDRFGLPAAGYPVRFFNTQGGGTVIAGTGPTGTDPLGIAFAQATLGPAIGPQQFAADIGNPAQFTLYFSGVSDPFPVIANGGVVDDASFRAGAGFAPGSYLAIFGRGLSPVTRAFTTRYLPVSLGGISVSFDVPFTNISLPGRITYVSDGQVNVQIPWELAGNSSAQMKISIGNSSSALYTLPLATSAPAFFEYPGSGGQLLLAAQDPQFALITPSHPALSGSTVLLYSNGLGPVNQPVASGEPSPSSAPRTLTTPTVKIGGKDATVSFSGLSPGSIGLYQINVVVPSGLPPGLQPVAVTMNGITSKTSMLPVR